MLRNMDILRKRTRAGARAIPHVLVSLIFVCLFRQPEASDVVLDGNITIAGMFEVNLQSDGGCGDINPASVMVMEAVRWYLEQLNTANALPFTLGFRGYRTCGNAGLAGNIATDILARYRGAKAKTNNEDFIVGLVGPEYSSEAEVVSSIFGSQTNADRMLVISPSATATSLNDRVAYPNFYRVIPDDSVQVKTMVQLMQSLDWNRIGIIYVNDSYGRNGAENLAELAERNNICVPKLFAIDTDDTRTISLDQLNEILNDIVIESPRIVGIVYIGDKHIANQVLLVTDRLSITDVPIFLMPESTELQKTVFQKQTGSLLTKAKGAMVMSSPVTEISSFAAYWNDPNSQAIDKNQYFSQLTPEVKNTLLDNQPVYVKYGILAAHTMVKAIKLAYESICPQKPCSSVDDFKENFQPSDLLNQMEGMTVSFRDDFGVVVNPLAQNNFTMTFSDVANPNTDGAQYEVYNFRHSGVTDDFTFIKVGYLEGGSLTLDTAEIKDYRSGGAETTFPDVRRGQCPVGYRCTGCQPEDLSDVHLHVPGDLYVIGIISNNNKAIPGPQGCGNVRIRHGYQMFLSMKFAIEEFTTASEYAQVRENFSGRSIGLIVLNDCNNPLEISRKVLVLHQKGLMLANGETLQLQNRILGYIGGQSTDVSQPAADQLTQLGIVQISYSATNPVLSNKDRYPYFMRIVTPDNVQASAMIALVKELGGKYIQLVYSAGAYGEGGRDSVVATAKQSSVCIAQIIRVEESSSYSGHYELLRRKPHAKLVIIFLRSHVVSPFMRDVSANMERGEFQFIGSEAWGRNSEVLEYDINQGSLTVALEMSRNIKLDTYIKGQTPLKQDVNSRLEEYIQNRQNCYFSFSFDKTFSKECTPEDLPIDDESFESDPWCIFATNTMFSFLEGSGEFFQQRCGAADHVCTDYTENPGGLVEEMKKVEMNIDGSGKIKLYDDKGDGSMGYKIFNIQGTDEDKSRKHYVEVGSFSIQSGLSLDKTAVKYPTDAVIVSSCPNEQACVDCTETATPTVDEPTKTTTSNLAYVFGVLFGLSVLVVITLAIVLIRQRFATTKEEDPYITPMEDRPSVIGSAHDGYARGMLNDAYAHRYQSSGYESHGQLRDSYVHGQQEEYSECVSSTSESAAYI